MAKNLSKLSSVAILTVLTTGLCTTASAESAYVSNSQPQSTARPMQSYVPSNGAVDLNSNHLLKRGIANYMEGDYSTAAMLLHRSLRGHPNDGFANYFMGLTKHKIGNTRGALPYLKRANKIFANAPQSYAALGEAYAKLGKTDKARAVLQKLDGLKSCSQNCAGSADIDAAKTVIRRALG